ncbi:helix-turn-helix domain-containing protein [Cupriavidus basilensis]|uniref:XRE family transcriptional regulator n=1 Tax=Cupriavidus basilensis TaxID=68895 RepID=A0A643FJB3_9BURK|nr:XRE family transcriptional regulator [Cupriavidus basilensis]QOT76326.1 XRE family transcriptional regulator [Cupriavidus basilensis]
MFPPETQGELIRWARGKSTQAEFAASLRINKSCLSRYESGKLGAPTHLINYCLRQLAEAVHGRHHAEVGLEGALENARRTVSLLEKLIEPSG